ncbi:hypothetical protein KEM54_002568 [Ascosphaera aggregata]|nr:hypothetical protein KEM54_002568 [Ascosphaera aggregata]
MTTAEATTSTTATTTNTTANATTTDNTTTTTPTPLDTTSSSPSSSSSSSENVTPIELAPTCSPGPVTPLALEPQTTATTMTSALTSTSTTAAAPSASGNDYLTAATPAFREKKLSTTTTNRLLCSLSKHELTGLSKSQLEPTLSRRVSKDDSVINESKSKGNRSRAKSMEQAN